MPQTIMIFFITERPYTYNLSGAAALSSSHLRFVRMKFPAERIHVIFLNEGREFWREAPDFDHSNIAVTPIPVPAFRFRILTLKSLGLFFSARIDALASGIFQDVPGLRQSLSGLNQALKGQPDARLIWCEHLMPLLYVSSILPEKSFGERVVYSHHDFLFKILRIRSKSLGHFARSLLVKRLETLLLRKVRYFVSGSVSELRQITALASGAVRAEFLPCLYPMPGPNGSRPSSRGVKIYHVGTASATANRVGIHFFLSKVFPSIEHLPFTLEFVGNVQDYVLREFPRLKNHPKIVFRGFVPNLEETIEEGMIHVIPYSGMTGTRTRVAGIARFKPCILGFGTIQDSYPFLTDGSNAAIAESDDDFVTKLKQLISDPVLRAKISGQILGDMSRFEARLLSDVRIMPGE